MAKQTAVTWTKIVGDLVVKWTKPENNMVNTTFLGTSGRGCMMRSFLAENFRPELVPDYVPYYYSAKTDEGTVVYYYTDGYGDSSRDCWAPFFEQKQIEYQRFENLRYLKSKEEAIQD